MKRFIHTLLFSLSTVLLFAQNMYITKGNTYHAYQLESIEEITFGHPDSMYVKWGDSVHSFARADIDSLSQQKPAIAAGAKAANNIFASETFSTDFGTFTEVTPKGRPWTIEFNTAKATGYANNSTTASESYLVSPAYDMTTSLEAVLSFQYILAYSRTKSKNKVLITDHYTGDPTTTQWTDITGELAQATTNNGKVDWYTFSTYEQEIPSRFLGESNVVIALYYSCTTTSTTWEVKNLQLILQDKWEEGGGDTPIIDPNNKNRNIITDTSNQEMWRLEFPKAKGGDLNLVISHSTQAYGITYSLEWDCEKKSQRWTCYQFHDGLPNNNVGRNGSWTDDPDIPAVYRTHDSDYKNTGFSRGHMCMSNDRQSSVEQNKQTFFISNAHPQYQKHNGGLWQTLENKVTNWGNSSDFRDTLYVVKAGTIDATDQVLTTTSTGLLVPKYFYMAVLCVKDHQYKALAFWTEHQNVSVTKANAANYAISVDQLEQLTGIDFFCNLPDDIEEEVEATLTLDDWGL